MGAAWAERIPVYGRLVRASNRAWTGLANKLRFDIADDMLEGARVARRSSGIINKLFGIATTDLPPEQDAKLLKSIASLVNNGTGRGDLGQLSRAAVVLNATLFSPRLQAARISLLNPLYYLRLEPYVRKEALKTLFTTAGMLGSVLGLAKLAGAKVGDDVYSADFGKIKIGKTRIDIGGGFQQYIRFVAQFSKGKTVSSVTGKTRKVGEGYPPLTRYDILQRFIEMKEAPVLSFATALMKGQTAIGEEVTVTKEIADRFTPMIAQDMKDLYEEWGTGRMLMLGTLAWFGIGLQTYGPEPPVKRPGSVYMPRVKPKMVK